MEKIFENIKLGKYTETELDLNISAFEMFKRLYPFEENIFLLESLGEDPDLIGAGGKYNRYSYIGCAPEMLLTAIGPELFAEARKIKTENPYKSLAQMSKLKNNSQNYCGGLVGYFSYEATAFFERSFKGFNSREFPDFQFGFFLDGFRFDRKGNKCFYFHYGKSRLNSFLKNFHKSGGSIDKFSFKTVAGPDKKKHKKNVEAVLSEIKKGNIFQAVLSERSDFHISGDNRRIYAVLRQVNPSPYMIYFKFGKREVISASPELLIRTYDNNLEHFGTLAGTIRRSDNADDDRILADKLLKDEKELAEHYMLVDLARNDVGRIARFGSITVEKLATIKKFSKVQHLYSEVRGKIRKGKNCFDAFEKCFPAGTLTGAPKIEAMKVINRLEGRARGPYGGTAGYFSLNGESMMAIVIRSLFINGNYAYTQTGSGIVLDSTPEVEFEEIINKQRGMDETLRRAAA